MTAPSPARPARNVLLLAAAAASWGFGTVVSKRAVAEMPALTLSVIQLAVSVAVMAVIALTVAGVVVCALYTVPTRRWILGTDATFPIVLSQQVHALGLIVVVAVVAAIAGQSVIPAQFSASGLLSAAVSGLLYYALAYSCYLTRRFGRSARRSLRRRSS